MPSEKSFLDRIGRFTLLKEGCDSMVPAFAPVDADIALAAQATLLTQLNACCTNVNNALTDLKDTTDARVLMVKTIKERVTRAVNRVKSNRAWAAKLPNVKAAGDKVRGMRPPRGAPPPAPTDPDAPAPKLRDRGGQGYRDIEGQLGKFVSALLKCSGYDTGAPADITTLMLTSLQSNLKAASDAAAEKEVTLRDFQIERLRVFAGTRPLADGTAPLQNRWARIKSSVKAQYGTGSAEYALVKGINY